MSANEEALRAIAAGQKIQNPKRNVTEEIEVCDTSMFTNDTFTLRDMQEALAVAAVRLPSTVRGTPWLQWRHNAWHDEDTSHTLYLAYEREETDEEWAARLGRVERGRAADLKRLQEAAHSMGYTLTPQDQS